MNDTTSKTLLYLEHNLMGYDPMLTDPDTLAGYYFVRYDWDGDASRLPTCEIHTEDSLSPPSSLPSPTDPDSDGSPEGRDGAVSTPTILSGASRVVYFPTLMGWINAYEFGADA